MEKEKLTDIPVKIKCTETRQAHEGTKMGWSVPQSTVEFFTDIRQPFIRSTPVMTLDHCPRKFLYADKLGLRPRGYNSPLTMGKIVHKVLEALFMGKTPEEAVEVCQRLVTKEQAKLVEDADQAGFLPTGEPVEKMVKKVEEDYHKARAVGLAFWTFVPFAADKYEILYTPDGHPMVETTLMWEYPGLSRPGRTPCDLALVEKETGDVWIVDHKTTTFDPRVRAIPTKISVQLALYRLGLQAHLDAWAEADLAPERKVVGSLHAIIKKPGIKLCGKDEKEAQKRNITPFAAYIERLIEWYRTEDAKDPKNPPLVLDPNRFPTVPMTRELWGRLKQYCRACQAAPNVDSFYKVGDSACLQYNKACSYMPLCNSDPAMWPDLIDQRYEVSFREDREAEEED